MEKTCERYAAALLAAEQSTSTEAPKLSVADEVIRRRTGRGWEEGFGLLDRPGRHRQAAPGDRVLALLRSTRGVGVLADDGGRERARS